LSVELASCVAHRRAGLPAAREAKGRL
jgi:hypothetical protein